MEKKGLKGLQRLKNNRRYIVIYCESGQYLIDTNKRWLSYIQPALYWMLPIKAMRLNNDLSPYLFDEEEEGKSLKVASFLGVLGIMAFLHFIIIPALSNLWMFNNDFKLNVIVLLSTVLGIVLYRIWKSIMGRRMLCDFVDFKTLETCNIVVRPNSAKFCFVILFVHFFLIGVISATTYAYLIYGDPLALLVFFIFGFIFSMINWLSFSAGCRVYEK